MKHLSKIAARDVFLSKIALYLSLKKLEMCDIMAYIRNN